MKTASTRELRQGLSRILSQVEQGEEMEITRRGRVIARLVPPGARPTTAVPPPPEAQKIKMPRFESSMKKLLGDE